MAAHPYSLAPLVDLTPFATHPPQLGGQVVIQAVNAALARAGQPVEQFSMGIRKADLPWLGRPRQLEHAPLYREHRRTEPLSALLFMASAGLRLPYLWAGRALAWRRWPLLERTVAGSLAVLIEMPWGYTPQGLRPPPGAPLIYVAQNAEFRLAEMWRGRWAGLGSRLAREAERQEARLALRADLIFAISDDDAAAMGQHYQVPPERLAVVPRGLDIEQYVPTSSDQRQQLRRRLGLGDEFVVVFAGSRHPPNLAAARLALDFGRALGAGFRVVVAGSVAHSFDPAAQAPAWLRPGNPAPYLQAADLAINPMLSGSGMNVKMLEYLAWGVPVLSTRWGARGIDGRDGLHFEVAEPEQMPTAITALARDPAARAALAQAGRALVAQRYSAAATARDYLARIARWQAQASRRPPLPAAARPR